MTPHIAFIGKTGSGKSTAAKILVEQFGYERLSFAGPLKSGCGTDDDRDLLQRVGQGVRELYADFWVNLFLAEFDRELRDRAVVDDARYPNEVAALQQHGFVIVRIGAPATMRIDRQLRNGRLQNRDQLTHISEKALDGFETEHRIVNDGWPEDLTSDLEYLLNELRS